MSFRKAVVIFVYILVQMISTFSSASAQTWVEDSFNDFSDGTLGAGGQNIYVSKDGKIRTIHRVDLNDDGYIDMLFSQTHNFYYNIQPTMADIGSGRAIKESSLAVDGSVQIAKADLNHNSYLDLIFCPNLSNVQNTRQFVTIIYGGKDGWPSYRSTGDLPVNDVKAIAIADLNHDGWDDIVTLNGERWKPGQPKGNIIRIFWGNNGGYLNTRYSDFGVSGAMGITSGDFNSDGASDLAVLKKDHNIEVYWAAQAQSKEEDFLSDTSNIQLPEEARIYSIASGDYDNNGTVDLLVGTTNEVLYLTPAMERSPFGKPQQIKSFSASDIIVGDIDKDGFNDLLLSFFHKKGDIADGVVRKEKDSGKAAHILWGNENGFSRTRSTNLKALNLSASTYGDFDGDGLKDIAIAINKKDSVYKAQSIIYYGKGNRRFVKGTKGITTKGALDVLAVSERDSKRVKVIFANSVGGNVYQKVPSYLYWNGPNGFSEHNRMEIPMRSGYEATAADFNADGSTDLAIMDAMNGGQNIKNDPWAGANIFWGDGNSIDISGRTVLTEPKVGSSNVADLNKDGYLDLVLGKFDDSGIVIYYGSKKGFSRDHRVNIPSPGRSLGVQLADYNKDGWLDIAVSSYGKMGIRIFYGSKEGYKADRQVDLEGTAVIDLETADLNNDGWLDIIAPRYSDKANNDHHDMGIKIYWGSPNGFNHADAQWLPSHTPLGPVVADFNGDGYLDIFAPSYHGDLSREYLPSYLYWGGPDGYQDQNRTVLINDSAAGGLAADFNKDGKLDLAVVNHSTDGTHNTFSKIFYNNGKRFKNARVKKLPTSGPHWSFDEDMGNIYDRSLVQTYESSVFHWQKNRAKGNISLTADVPSGTQLVIKIRSAADKIKLKEKKWIKINSDNDNAGGRFEINAADQFLQYKAVFISDNGDRFPVLDKVIVELGDS